MIQHIVMWKFKDSAHGKSKAEHMEWMRSHLLALPPLIPQLKKMKIEFDASGNHSNYDAVLLTVFDDFDALQSYKVCPDHVKICDYAAQITEKRACVDFVVK